MSLYKHILCAVDLSEDADIVLEKACSIADRHGAKLTVVHVVEPLSVAYGSDIPLDLNSLQDEIAEQARERVKNLANKISCGCNEADQLVIYGIPEREVHRLANEKDADLIVVGSHGRHGLSLILGSTSTSILHGARCDVLAVRVGRD